VVILAGTFNGVVYVDISLDGGTSWPQTVEVCAGTLFPASSNYAMRASQLLRLRCQSYVSGTLTYTLIPPQPAVAPDMVVGVLGVGNITISSGSGPPTSIQPSGSLYTNQTGGPSSRLYISMGAGSWAPVASV